MKSTLNQHVLAKPSAVPHLNKPSFQLRSAPFQQPRRASGGLRRKQGLICSTTFKEKETVVEPGTTGDVEREEVFDWDKCWYPVAVVNDLEPKRPTPVKLLERDFVLWRDVNEEWRCFEDACPHRLAPLSEGRIEPSDGSLMCSYHGWRFQSDGECTRIPQAKDGGASGGCKNPRSRAKAFPVKVERELVWIWPDDSPSSFIDSTVQGLKGKDYYTDDEYLPSVPYMRVLPYPFDFLLENILDPSHVPFSHHGYLGSRENVRGHEARKGESSVPNELKYFFTAHLRVNGADEVTNTTITFNPPDLIQYNEKYREFYMQIRASPVSSTSSRIFFQYIEKKKKSFLENILRSVMFPPWFFHLIEASIEDGDMVFLHAQARRVRRLEEEGKGWDSEYFMPVSCDAAVVGFRRWLSGKIGGGGPKLPSGRLFLQNSFPQVDRRQLLDRYNSHTKHCKICTGTLKNVRILKVIARAAYVGFAVYSLLLARALLTSSAGGCVWKLVRSVCCLLACGFATQKMATMEQQLIFVDYEHWKTIEEKNPLIRFIGGLINCLFS